MYQHSDLSGDGIYEDYVRAQVAGDVNGQIDALSGVRSALEQKSNLLVEGMRAAADRGDWETHIEISMQIQCTSKEQRDVAYQMKILNQTQGRTAA